MPRRHRTGRHAARAVRRAGCCGMEALGCCLVLTLAIGAAAALTIWSLI